jgi:hypothetical protein
MPIYHLVYRQLQFVMTNIRLLSIPSSFNCLPNELVLIIWMYLGHVEAIRIFGSMKCQRYTCLLEEYCYKSINFRETSLSTFQLYYSHLFNKIRLNVKTLKIGHRFSYSRSNASRLVIIDVNFDFKSESIK